MENKRRPVDPRGKYIDFVFTHDIPGIIEENKEALDFFFKYRRFGNPFNRGWRYWPAWALEIISTCEAVDWTAEPE